MNLNLLQLGLAATFVLFAFAFGACAGSLTNVLVYRLPRGMDAIWTGSRCPACETPLTWRENFPVFGWIFLRGRCRFCRSKISAEYPLVEALVGGLWAGMFVLYFVMAPSSAISGTSQFLGVNWASMRPEWAGWDAQVNGWPSTTWHIFLVHLIIVASLVAMTLVDAKTFTIPLAIPWFATAVGIGLHTLGAALTQWAPPHHLRETAPNAIWALATPGWSINGPHGTGWWWIGASIGAVVGLVLSNLLLHFNLIRRSFADYPEWEQEALKAQGHSVGPPSETDAKDPDAPVGEHVGPGVRLVLCFTLAWLGALVVLGGIGALAAPGLGYPQWVGVALGATLGPLCGALACRFLPGSPTKLQDSGPAVEGASASPSAPELWIAYPHARREMFKELLFLTPCIGLVWLGGTIAARVGDGATPPLWLAVLCGTLMGYLIGGGAIWLIRIGGSLAFGKEAMGLGDVHLMAAVGACLGWIDAVLAIPLAAVVGLYWVIISIASGRPAGRAMPFGPYLAIGTLLVMFGKPLVEMGLSFLTAFPINLP